MKIIEDARSFLGPNLLKGSPVLNQLLQQQINSNRKITRASLGKHSLTKSWTKTYLSNKHLNLQSQIKEISSSSDSSRREHKPVKLKLKSSPTIKEFTPSQLSKTKKKFFSSSRLTLSKGYVHKDSDSTLK